MFDIVKDVTDIFADIGEDIGDTIEDIQDSIDIEDFLIEAGTWISHFR